VRKRRRPDGLKSPRDRLRDFLVTWLVFALGLSFIGWVERGTFAIELPTLLAIGSLVALLPAGGFALLAAALQWLKERKRRSAKAASSAQDK